MNTLSFNYLNKPKTYRAPLNWNGLTPLQLIRWAAVVFGKASEGDKLRLAVAIMYGIEWKVYKNLADHYKAQLFPTVKFAFSQCELNNWLIKKLRIRYRQYYGPADKLSNLTANEFFNFTEVLYSSWQKTKAEGYLNALCAVLYRPKRKTEVFDDVRCILTDAGVALRAKKFKQIDLSVKQAILLNYEGCRMFIIKNNPDIFKSNGRIHHNQTARDLVLALSDGPFGNYTATQEANLYKFLQHVNQVIEQNKPTP